MTSLESQIPSFFDGLRSDGPAPDRAEAMGLYGWLVGRWQLDVEIYRNDGSTERRHGFACADWVLEGRAIQDVFAVPGLFYGSTLRVYEPGRGAWRVLWTDPLHQVYVTLIGHRDGDEIVNEGDEPPSLARLYGPSNHGRCGTIRWTFSDITPVSFTWRSERTEDGGGWQLQRRYLAHRIGDNGP